MKIQVVANNNQVREIYNKEKTKVVARKQEVYADLGGAFPEKTFVRIDQPLQPGKYEAALKYRVNRYGDLEINPFETPEFKAV